MKLSTNGIVIWQVKTGDAHRVITILSQNGLITAFARNSLRPGNKLASATALFSYSSFELFSGSNMYNVDDAGCLSRFMSLASDVDAVALASYFCELMKTLAPVDDNADDYLQLMLNSLWVLNGKRRPLRQVKSVFELRLMALAGYMPDLIGCGECGRGECSSAFFDTAGAEWFCERCAGKLNRRVNCEYDVIEAMRHIVYSPAKNIFSFTVADEQLKTLCALSERYVLERLERSLPTLEFFNSICSQ